MDLGNVSFVLHRPSSAENIGSVARAMKNFGLARLVIVAPPSWSGLPRGGGPGSARDEVLVRARKTARRAADVLESAAVHTDLQSALAGTTWAWGTTSRGLDARRTLDPSELGREVARRAGRGPVAIVFGEERRGLSDRELRFCQEVCTIPTHAAYDSMNLAQAAAVLAYAIVSAEGTPAPVLADGHPARHATMEALWKQLQALLATVGYLNPQNPEHILADWRKLLARAEPTQREVELLVAALRAVRRKLAGG